MKNSTRTIRSIICLPLVAMATLAATMHMARAQDQPSAPAGESSTAHGGLQEIVVTATRREEALSRVPISVTALTQEALDQKGIKDIRDMVRFTPGVTIDDSGTNAISIRGISSSGAPARPGSTSTTPRSRCARSASIPTTPCLKAFRLASASKCCAVRRAHSSAPAPRAARCATS